MRRYLMAAAAMLLSSAASAVSIPLLLNYQGKLLDASTNAPKNGSVSFQFRILDAASGGNVLWGPETQTLTVTNGVFSAQLGSALALSTDVFSGVNAFLSVTAAPDVYPGGEMTPRQQLVASPYAVTAQQVASVGGIRVNPGVAYSTFTAGGDLHVNHGVNASTGVFTGTGASVYSIVLSSGLQINAGTLAFKGGIIDASASGVWASTITTTQTGNNSYAMYLSTGLFLSSGTIKLSGANAAIDAGGYQVSASTLSATALGLFGGASSAGAVNGTVIVQSTSAANFNPIINFQNNTGASVLQVRNDGHIHSQATAAPTVSACGTTPSITGTDMAGQVTIGTGVTTSCTVTFKVAYPNAPACVIGANSTARTFAAATTTTTLTITSSGSMASAVISYVCIGI